MGMYPPGVRPPIEDKDPIPILPMGDLPPEMALKGSPTKMGLRVQHDNSKNGNRNI